MVNTLMSVSAVIILLSMALAVLRFIKGKTSIDRVIAFDIMTIASVALIAIISYQAHRVIYLDVAIVYGLLSFLAVIIIAKYLEKSL